MGLILAKHLMSPQKILSSTKFIIFISWCSVCTPLIPGHYHWNGWCPWLQQDTEKHGDWVKHHNDKGKVKGPRGDHLFSFLNWILFSTIHIRQIDCHGNWGMKIKCCRRLSNALAEFTYLCWRHQWYLKETALFDFSFCCSSLIIANYWI